MNGAVPTWTAAVIITAAWHAVWWMGLVAKPQHRQLPPPPPGRLSYVPVIAESHELAFDQGDVRTLWSPALFSLPTSVGFSRLLLSQDRGIEPPVDMVTHTDVRLQRTKTSPVFRHDPSAFGLDPASLLMQPPGKMSAADLMPAPLTPRPARLLIQPQPGTPPPPEERILLPGLDSMGAVAWTTPMEVSVSESGLVDRVLIASPPEDAEVAATLVRAVYAWSFSPGPPRVYRLRVSFRPAMEAREARESGVGS